MLSGIIPPQEDKAHAATDKAPGTVIGRTSLLARLVILVVVSTIPALLVLAYLEHDLRAEGRERIGAEALRQAELLNADMSNVVEGARQLSSGNQPLLHGAYRRPCMQQSPGGTPLGPAKLCHAVGDQG